MDLGGPDRHGAPMQPHGDHDRNVPQVVRGTPVPVAGGATFRELVGVEDETDEVRENARDRRACENEDIVSVTRGGCNLDGAHCRTTRCQTTRRVELDESRVR